MVTISAYVKWTNSGGSNQFRIGGLPYPVKGIVNYYPSAQIGYCIGLTSVTGTLTGWAPYGANFINIGQILSGEYAAINIPASGEVMITINYETDQ
jgi:hypothetical protein